MKPQISVIIPTYKPDTYIRTCLDSLSRQSLDKGLWEMILVLNGCDEPWLSELQSYKNANSDLSVQILQTDTPGVSNARNIGINHATGEYLTFIDDDDYVSPSYLEELLKIASPDTIAASYTKAFSDVQEYIPYYIEQEYNTHAKDGKQPFAKAKRYFSGPCMKLIHRAIIGDTRFDIHFSSGEDSIFMFELSNRMTFIDFTSQNAIYFRRVRSNSASNNLSRKAAIQNGCRLIKKYFSIYQKDHSYSFRFFATRLLGVIHSLISYGTR